MSSAFRASELRALLGRRAAAALVCVLGVGLGSEDVHAHGREHSYSSWALHADGARARLRIARLPPGLDAGRVVRRLRLRAEEDVCRLEAPPRRRLDADGWLLIDWAVRCPTADALVLENELLPRLGPGHLHFARVTLADGRVVERVLSGSETRWELRRGGPAGDTPPQGTSFTGYLGLGVAHILSGWDHLAFVLALLLLAGTLREVAFLVTAFTLAHSVTLALAALEWVRPEPVAVEALIGFSIALVAAENAWILGGRDRVVPRLATAGLVGLLGLAALGIGGLPPLLLAGLVLFSHCHFELLRRSSNPQRLRVFVAFGFGLVHGFGFAGLLAEVGLPPARVVPALLGFNLGVEVGQLGVVGLVWPLLRALARHPPAPLYGHVAALASAVICGLGVFWFVTRAYG